ncbi:MAG: M24 family metallopeptidase [Candidatus Pacearchaeota archaeon]|nr:M24 family metallopeptidase [Candidatus Pacearchaeota archaeon]
MNKVQSIRKACEINDKIFLEITRNFRFKTERDLEKYILKRFRQEGAGRAYRPIVANNNSVIHAKPRDKRFSSGFLVLDFGCKFNGWCSDMTRTIFIGKAGEEEKKLYNLVLSCQEKCIKKVREGVFCCELDIYSRTLLKEKAQYFKHALGHGVGKKVHEKPRVSPWSPDVLKEGQVITIEPGIYIKKGKKEFGIRVEDTLLVNSNGCEVFCKASKKFIEIKLR